MFKNRLIEKYASLAELNTIWGSEFATWEDWMKNDSVYAGATNDLIDFTSHMANAYFRSVKEALKAKAPHKLIWVAGLIMETLPGMPCNNGL